MDIIAMHQAGIPNTVAPLGTAFTDDQARLIHRWADQAILVFDLDKAGQDAAYKSILTCRKAGLRCSLTSPEKFDEIQPELNVKLTNIKDPADILTNYGPKVLNKYMKCIINDFDYLIFRSRTLFTISLPDGKRAALFFLFPYLEVLNSEVERNDCLGIAADAFRIDRDAIQRDYLNRKSGGKKPESAEKNNEQVRMNDELYLLTIVAINPYLYPELRRSLEIRDIEDPAAKELFVALEECFVNDEIGIDPLLARIDSAELQRFIMRRGTSPEFRGDSHTNRHPVRIFNDRVKRIKEKRLRSRLDEIVAELHREERNPGQTGEEMYNDLLDEKMRIDIEIRKLEGR
jgi:DNA primase